MVDHLARAEEMRARAKNCELLAEQSKSEKFAACYRLLVDNYNTLATVEEEFLARTAARIDVTAIRGNGGDQIIIKEAVSERRPLLYEPSG